MQESADGPGGGRDGFAADAAARRDGETERQRLNRKWNDLLQELRVMQTGAQLVAGFLLTLPFQGSFDELDDFQVALYLTLVVLALLTTATVMAPVATHRRLSGRQVKGEVVRNAHRLAGLALTGIGLLITLITLFVFDIVADRVLAVVMAAGIGVVVVGLLVVRPRWIERRSPEDPEDPDDARDPGGP